MNKSVQQLTTAGLFPCEEREIRHVVSFSGGAGSWASAKRLTETVPLNQITLLFADTIIEDQTTYCFVMEAAANIFGLTIPWILKDMALGLPELQVSDPHCVERKEVLSQLRQLAMKHIPGLTWIADGRHPWEVFEVKGFIGNSKADPCSEILKRNLLDKWRDTNCKVDSTVCYVGIDWSEQHRLKRMLPLVAPWLYEAPLCEEPYLTKPGIINWLREHKIRIPRLYEAGFPHNNCGGFCCKAGHAHFAHFYRVRPGRYAWHEWWENRLREQVGDYSMMSDRRGCGDKKPLTMTALRLRIEAGEEFGSEEWGGCGCALAS